MNGHGYDGANADAGGKEVLASALEGIGAAGYGGLSDAAVLRVIRG